MRILVTGAAGFIGSRLVPELRTRGHDVVGVDRSEGDLAVQHIAQFLIFENQPEMVVHLAAQPGRVFGEVDPLVTMRENVATTINVARACEAFDAQICYTSTSEVYGDCSDSPLHERSILGRPLNLYAATKAWGEQVVRMYAPHRHLIIRPSMPYGPGMAVGYGRAALPTMIDNLLRGETFTVHRGTARSWCYIDDLVRGMADVIELGAGIYNVGRDDDLRTMEEVAGIVCNILDVDHSLIEVGEHDPTIRPVKDISMGRLRDLGWRPEVDLIEGITRTAASLLAR